MTENAPTTPDLSGLAAAIENGGLEALAAMAPPNPERSTYLPQYPELGSVSVRDVAIPAPVGEMPGRIYRDEAAPVSSAFVWAHGGGFAAGDLDMPEAHWVGLMLAARGIPVLSLDYRKATGGVHFPAPSDDVLAGWLWAVEHPSELGGPASLHLGGASAGGSLTAGVTKRLRDTGGPLPATLLLAYPTLHPDLPPASEEVARVTAPLAAVVPPQIMQLMSFNYAGSADVLANPYAFRGLGDLSGLPRTYVLNSEVDLLRASGEAFAVGVTAAGGDVTLEHEPGSGHGHLNQPLTDPARASIARMAAWLTGTSA